MEGQPLLGVLRGLILDGEEQADFAADPSGYMQRAGYDDMSEEDLGEAVSLVADTLPPDVAQAVTSAAAVPDGAEGDGGGALGLLERVASVDAENAPPLQVPDPVDVTQDADADADLGGWGAEDAASSFGDVTQDFDDEGAGDAYGEDDLDDLDDAFAGEAAEPDLPEGADVPLSQAHDVDDDPVDIGIDVDVDADAGIGFGEGSPTGDPAALGADTGAGLGGLGGAEAGGGEAGAEGEGLLGDDAFGADFGDTGDAVDLDADDTYGDYDAGTGADDADDLGYDDGPADGLDAGGDDMGAF
jgi:hypothetical protein